jgi:hypothetical protein
MLRGLVAAELRDGLGEGRSAGIRSELFFFVGWSGARRGVDTKRQKKPLDSVRKGAPRGWTLQDYTKGTCRID